MKKFKDILGMIRLFFRLVFELIKNYRSLNEDLEHNFLICKKICKKIVRSANIQLSTYAQEKLPEDKPFLLVPNHRCFFDVVFLLAESRQPISFVAAKELFNYPLLHHYLNSIRCICLDRYTKDITKLKESIAEIQGALRDHNLVLFPEGECSYHNKNMNPFKKGGFMGIAGLNMEIVPAFIDINKIRNIGRWMIPVGQVGIFIGEPFRVEDVSTKRMQAGEIASYAQSRVRELQRMADGEREEITKIVNNEKTRE